MRTVCLHARGSANLYRQMCLLPGFNPGFTAVCTARHCVHEFVVFPPCWPLPTTAPSSQPALHLLTALRTQCRMLRRELLPVLMLAAQPQCVGCPCAGHLCKLQA